MQEKSLILNNLFINYLQSDNFQPNKTIVLVHGWASEASHLSNIFDGLDNFIALDLPGFGKSDEPKEVWGVNEYTELLGQFIQKKEINNPILVGHSFGGSLIIKYVASGGKAEKIVLVDSAGIRSKSVKVKVINFLAIFLKIFLNFPVINLFKDQIRKYFYKLIDSEDYINAGSMVESYKKVISQDLSKEMEIVKVPTFLIWGEDDTATPIEDAHRMNSLIQGSTLNIIKNAKHFVFIDKPGEFKKIFINLI